MNIHLIDEWWTVLKNSAVSKVSLVIGTITGSLAVNALVALGVLPFVPLWLQLPSALIIGLLYYGPIMWARVVSQPKMNAKVEEKLAEKADAQSSQT